MLLHETMRSRGEALFRRRSFVLLAFIPLIGWALTAGEPVERFLGEAWGGIYETACVIMILAGLVLRAFTVGFVPRKTSGRNTAGQVAEALNTTGLYSLTRNPLYLANSLTYLGIVLAAQNLVLALAFVLFLALYYERIILAEEAFLLEKFGDAYRRWAAEVPALVPRLTGWTAPALPFSLRSVVRREPPTWLGAAAAFAAIDLAGDLFTGEAGHVAASWALPLVLALAAAGTRVGLERWTRLLRAPGR